MHRRAPWAVVVVAATAAVAAWVALGAGAPDRVIATRIGEPAREAPQAPGELEVRPAAARRVPAADESAAERAPDANATGPASGAAADAGRVVPLRVTVVDGEDGHELVGSAWTAGRALAARADEPPPVFASGAEVDVRVADAPSPTALGVGWPRVDGMPSGYAAGPRLPDVVVSRFAASLVATWPLPREADLVVDFTIAGRPPSRRLDVVMRATVAGATPVASGPPVLPEVEPVVGGFRLRRVPFLRGAAWTLDATVSAADGLRRASRAGAYGPDVARPIRPVLDLPADAQTSFAGHGGSRTLRGGPCGRGCRALEEDGARAYGGVVARALRRDGRPAVGARVRLRDVAIDGVDPRWGGLLDPRDGRADARGEVRFERVATGSWEVDVDEPGYLAAVVAIRVRADAITAVDVAEAAPASIDVLVVDEEERAVPFARLEVRSATPRPWVDLDGDAQRVDPFTDAAGRRTLRNLEAGTTEVEASYGGRVAKAAVPLAAGESARLRLTLAAPPPVAVPEGAAASTPR